MALTLDLTKTPPPTLNLTKEVPGLVEVEFWGMWNPNKNHKDEKFDLDLILVPLMYDSAQKPMLYNLPGGSLDYVCFFNQRFPPFGGGPRDAIPTDKNPTVIMHKDNQTGEGDGKDEKAVIYTDRFPTGLEEYALFININDAVARQQNFGRVEQAVVGITDNKTGKEIVRYNLTQDYGTAITVQVGSLVVTNGKIEMVPVGQGLNFDLEGILKTYGYGS